MTSSDKAKLDGIAAGAEVNQNAFSSITVGSDMVAADAKTDSFTLTAGSNVNMSVSGDQSPSPRPTRPTTRRPRAPLA